VLASAFPALWLSESELPCGSLPNPVPIKPHQISYQRNALTSLPNQQEEPNTPRQINNQQNRISRIPQQMHNPKESPIHFVLDPTIHNSRRRENGMRRRFVGAGCSSDEGGGEAPGDADEQEAEDVAEDVGGVCWWRSWDIGGIHFGMMGEMAIAMG